MSKVYFEMTENEGELTHLAEMVEYAGNRMSVGIGGEYQTLSTSEVIDIQSKIAEHLYEAVSLIRQLVDDVEKVE